MDSHWAARWTDVSNAERQTALWSLGVIQWNVLHGLFDLQFWVKSTLSMVFSKLGIPSLSSKGRRPTGGVIGQGVDIPFCSTALAFSPESGENNTGGLTGGHNRCGAGLCIGQSLLLI